jgi:hypothetical protein
MERIAQGTAVKLLHAKLLQNKKELHSKISEKDCIKPLTFLTHEHPIYEQGKTLEVCRVRGIKGNDFDISHELIPLECIEIVK